MMKPVLAALAGGLLVSGSCLSLLKEAASGK
jgi:hypothetical protein